MYFVHSNKEISFPRKGVNCEALVCIRVTLNAISYTALVLYHAHYIAAVYFQPNTKSVTYNTHSHNCT